MRVDLRKLSKLDFSKSTGFNRLLVLVVLFGMLYACISIKVIYLSVYDEYGKQTSLLKQRSWRKEIIDRNGKVLATNVPSASAFLNPNKIKDKPAALEALLNAVPNLNRKKLAEDLNSGRNFVWIKRDLSPLAQKKLHDLGIPSLEFEEEYKRVYMYGNLASHIIGYTGRDNKGLAGVEKYFDNDLTHNNTNNNENTTNSIAVNIKNQLQLSIDIDIQNVITEELTNAIKDFNAVGGIVIVANPNNGEILGIASKPDFDLNNVNKAKPEDLFSSASLGVYEIGSVFKAILLAIAFDTNTVSITDAYNLANFQVANLTVKDHHKHEGWHTVPEIFMHSSNIGVAQMALEMGGDIMKAYLQKLGLFNGLSIELSEKGSPLFPSRSKKWDDITLVTMAYGYSISITPLHFIQAMIPIVNGGIFYPVTLIKGKNDSIHKENNIVLSKDTSSKMQKLMRLTVTDGTATKAEVAGYLVGGKTGTAQKLKNGRYSMDHRMSSLISIVPSHDPQYIIYMLLDDPKGNKSTFGFATAGYTVAPYINKIITKITALHNIKPIDQNSGIEESMRIEYKMSGNKDM